MNTTMKDMMTKNMMIMTDLFDLGGESMKIDNINNNSVAIFNGNTFSSNSLYNNALIFNEDNTTSIRIGAIVNNSVAGKVLLDRAIDNGLAIKERTALLVGDLILDTDKFRVFYYPDTFHKIEIPLTLEEQKSAFIAFKDKFFISEKQYDKFKDSAIKTGKNVWENEKFIMEFKTRKLGETVNVCKGDKVYQMPLIDYLEERAQSSGFDSLKDMLECGLNVEGYENISLDVLNNYYKNIEEEKEL